MSKNNESIKLTVIIYQIHKIIMNLYNEKNYNEI